MLERVARRAHQIAQATRHTVDSLRHSPRIKPFGPLTALVVLNTAVLGAVRPSDQLPPDSPENVPPTPVADTAPPPEIVPVALEKSIDSTEGQDLQRIIGRLVNPSYLNDLQFSSGLEDLLSPINSRLITWQLQGSVFPVQISTITHYSYTQVAIRDAEEIKMSFTNPTLRHLALRIALPKENLDAKTRMGVLLTQLYRGATRELLSRITDEFFQMPPRLYWNYVTRNTLNIPARDIIPGTDVNLLGEALGNETDTPYIEARSANPRTFYRDLYFRIDANGEAFFDITT